MLKSSAKLIVNDESASNVTGGGDYKYLKDD